MKISVAMATYNGEKYIIEQLQSIYNQTLKPDEVIICDDCSVDSTVELINDFIKSNNLQNQWKLLINENSLGFINNFLKAISLSTGDVVFLSDQDDNFKSDKFEVMVNYFLKYPDCIVLNANYTMINDQSELINNYRIKSPKRRKGIHKLKFKEYLYNSNYPGFSIGFKGEIRNKLNKIDLENVYGHDILINILGIGYDGAYEINEILSYYRLHSNNTTGGVKLVENNSINSRTNQKIKELNEYDKLIKFCRKNSFNKIDYTFLDIRKRELKVRIDSLKKRNLISLIKLFMKSRAYPKKTIMGDILYLMKGRE